MTADTLNSILGGLLSLIAAWALAWLAYFRASKGLAKELPTAQAYRDLSGQLHLPGESEERRPDGE